MSQSLPATVGRYEIRRELGRGMMGIVYEALDPALGRKIALKTIQLAFAVSEDERKSFEQRFLTEARVAARLSHPGIVVVHDVGQDASTGTLYIALEFLQGRTLAEVVAAGKPIDWQEALEVCRRVALALHHAHTEGVIHRDVKPANIMILPNGEPKIMDFGIAKVEASQLTAAGQFFGTPLYMSPEQALGRAVDARSDLFSLGTVAYVLLTGKQPFGAAGMPQILMRVIQEDPPPPTVSVPSLPPDLDYLVARALAKDPKDRYPSGLAMVDDIEDVLAGRRPRHRETWAAPPVAEGTLVARGSGGGSEQRTPPVTAPPPAEAKPPAKPTSRAPSPATGRTRPAIPPAPTKRRPSPRRGFPWGVAAIVAVAAAAAGIAAFMALRPRAEPVAEAETPAMTPAPSPEIRTRDEVQPAPLPTPPEPTPELPPSTRPRPFRAEEAAEPGPSEEGRTGLELDFEHSLKYGRLRLFVDETLVVESNLDSQVTRKIASLRLRKGRLEQTLEVPAGRHEIKLEVAWDDNVKTGRIWANFVPGETRRLSVKLGTGIGGLVKKSLDLEWR